MPTPYIRGECGGGAAAAALVELLRPTKLLRKHPAILKQVSLTCLRPRMQHAGSLR